MCTYFYHISEVNLGNKIKRNGAKKKETETKHK
jgi:hypothetical protein